MSPSLIGRSVVQRRLEDEFRSARSGQGRVVVVRGEPGIGRSAVLDLAAGARGMELVRTRGVESERAMPFAGLQQLCTTLHADLTSLDSPQRAAIEAAFGVAEGRSDPYLIGLATLALLIAVAKERPALILIDDAHWLDAATSQALAFAFRRIDAHPIAVVLATPAEDDDFAQFPTLRLTGLSDADGRALLRTATYGGVDEAVLSRIVAEARGNPRDILAAVDGVMSPDFAGGYGVVCAGADTGGLDERMANLTSAERLALILAAADPTGDPALQWRAADVLGLGHQVARTLQDQGWLRHETRVLFVDPALRPAVYCLATSSERDEVHAALATATDTIVAPDRRAWHLALATTGPDDQLATELEHCAAHARRRCGRAGEAAFLERSALLTRDADVRSARLLAAAAAKFDIGSAPAAVQLLAAAGLGRLDGRVRRCLDQQQARLAFVDKRNGPAVEQMLQAAEERRRANEPLACEGFLETLVASTYAGRLGPGTGAFARRIPTDWTCDGTNRDLLVGLTARFATGFAASHHLLRPVVGAVADQHPSKRWLGIGARIAADLWDDDLWDELTSRAVDLARETGALMRLPYALTDRCLAELHFGNFDTAQHLVDRIDALTTSSRAPSFPCGALLLAGWRGAEEVALPQIEAARQDAMERGEGIVFTTAALSAAVLANGLGRYDVALAAARDVVAEDELVLYGWGLTELIEAAARSGQSRAAESALETLAERARAVGTDWALGLEARSRALLTDGPEAERLYQQAIDHLARTRVVVHLARTRLVYGEWLRREGRRVDARVQLKAARDRLAAAGATAFTERAHREYLATGDRARRRIVDHRAQLTPQETSIAALAGQGLTNPEIGERLFLSPRTVEYHLHKVFEKFGISSRRALLRKLAPDLAGERG
ncbi:helix-turn-helix transcriptional regulator [Kribbella jiaozuonensis]|uniref:helix-turn-helix transcriptional regulator n=1 Tax=Kribbella jiaozuonensis TaxID=2575441 RepID=UPI001484C8B1|nr:LuxR family transcriptional regulator [Kribbella jiaozuonensis]